MRLAERAECVAFQSLVASRAAGAAIGRIRPSRSEPADIFLCIADHFEPQVGRPGRATARRRVVEWLTRYPAIADRHRDADGCIAKHTFFYPWDEYDPWELDRLVELCAAGHGEIELHLHHQDDTEESLRAKLRAAVDTFRSHGALGQTGDGRPAFAFVHGNWALCNSRNDGGRNYCGVNDELRILQEEGCYADFTFPAWRQQSQPRQANSIYYALSRAGRPKGHDRGEPARVGRRGGDGLLIIQGPLVPHVSWRRGLPRLSMDDGDLAHYRAHGPARLDRWVRAGICVQGRPDRIFIKLHTHGAQDANLNALLGRDLDALFSDAEARFNDGARYRLHYVSAREMYNAVKATEAGVEDLEMARDWTIKPAPALQRSENTGSVLCNAAVTAYAGLCSAQP